jgi:hypothetical protein
MNTLPVGILSHIIGYCNVSQCKMVCKRWCDVVKKDHNIRFRRGVFHKLHKNNQLTKFHDKLVPLLMCTSGCGFPDLMIYYSWESVYFSYKSCVKYDFDFHRDVTITELRGMLKKFTSRKHNVIYDDIIASDENIMDFWHMVLAGDPKFRN